MRVWQRFAPLTLVGALMLSVVGMSLAQKELASGVKPGGKLPAYHPTHVSGPDKNTDTCPVCKYPFNPAVQVWVNTDDMKNVGAIVETLEKAIQNNPGKKLKAFVVFINPKGESPSALGDRLQALAEKKNIEQVSICYLPGPKDSAVKDYQINTDPQVKNTVFVYKDRKVSSKFVNLVANEKGIKSLNDAIQKVL